MTPDTPTIRRRVLSRLIGSPTVLGPATLGATAMIAGWAAGLDPVVSLFIGAAGVALSAGAAATQWFLRGDAMIQRAIGELERERDQRSRSRFQELDQRLAKDGDEQTNAALAALLTLDRRAEELADHADTPGSVPPGTLSNLRQLIASSIDSLGKAADLHETADQLLTPAARRDVAQHRNELLLEVEQSINHVARTLDTLKTLRLERETAPHRLAELRAELDQSLDVAKRVEQRVHDLERGIERGERL